MVAEGNMVKILDFGLSHKSQPAVDPDETMDFALDSRGLSGTPCYLSPERTWGEPASAASDIFALGLTFHEMLTGHRTIRGSNLLDVLNQIRRIDPVAVAADVPEPFSAILRRSLDPDPTRRSADMRMIARTLEEHPASDDLG
jgi:serine/threonine-protein kinase